METVRIDLSGATAVVRLCRPEVRNAFNETLIAELTDAFRRLDRTTRVVVLTGEGGTFCAGADVAWMRKSKESSEAENERDASRMAGMLRAIDECPVPVVARIEGAALGGGSGLVAAADIAVAAEGSQFGFTEARLGLIPAVISTFVLPKIGARSARRHFLTADRFGAREAQSMGLIHEVVPPAELDSKVREITDQILECGPEAVRAAKQLLRELAGMGREQAIDHSVRAIARIRVSPEAQEGLQAFLEKRRPRWS